MVDKLTYLAWKLEGGHFSGTSLSGQLIDLLQAILGILFSLSVHDHGNKQNIKINSKFDFATCLGTL